jgi:hypothetical protein
MEIAGLIFHFVISAFLSRFQLESHKQTTQALCLYMITNGQSSQAG